MRLSGIAETVAALNYQMSTPSGAIEDSVLAPELDGIRQVGEASNLDQIEEQFSNIENNLIARIKQIPRLRISFEGWLNLLLMIFIFIYSTIASDQFQGRFEGKVDAIARLDVRILESQKRIYESFMDHMKESDLTGTFYIALHKANLKARPSNKSLTISTIYPNQLLKLEKRKSKWIYVTYFDYVKGISCKGWVLKKYLKMVRS
jgi:hypothetical protein